MNSLVNTLCKLSLALMGKGFRKFGQGKDIEEGEKEGFNSIELLHLRDGSYTYFLETCDLYLLVGFEDGQ